MQKAIVNTFSGGIERDLSINKYDNTHYYDAQNMVLNTNKELSSQALNSIRGSLAKGNISGQGVKLLGFTTIRDKVILFVKNGTDGAIFQFIDDGTDFDDPAQLVLIYTHPDLIFDEDLPIRAVGRYETEDIQKVYFTDTVNFFYHLNIIHNENTNDLQTVNKITPNTLELLANVSFNNIQYTVERGGNLRAGRIQYAYQLYNVNGSETVISPTSSLINLTTSDDNASSTMDYRGSKAETISNKSVRLEIPIDDDTFIRLRLYSIHYESDIALPIVRIVGEYNIKDLAELSVTDTGQSIDSFTLDELRFIQQDVVPKTLETKDNILFAGNIKTRYFRITDTEFDARAFRFNTAGISVLNQGESTKELTITTAAGVIQNYPTEEDNCYNIFNDLDNDKYRYNANPLTSKTIDYRYKADGSTLGGSGKYISYEFITVPKVIDTEPIRNNLNILKTGYYYPKQQVKVDSPFDSYANYRTSAEYTGYQRDEIYAFGIVFFDSKGRQSFVKWIGDIRFPNNDDLPFISYESASQHTIANLLGINFSISEDGRNILKSLGVTSYQIVRTERRDSDKTVKASGVIAFPYTRSTEPGNPKMYSVSTVPTIGDCKDKTIVDARRTYPEGIRHPEDNEIISDGNIIYLANNINLPLSNEFVEFNSPEISFNKRLNISSADFVEVNGALTNLSWTAIQDRRASATNTRRPHVVSDKFKNFTAYPKNETQVYDLPYSRARVNTARVFTQIDNQFQAPYIFPDGKIYSKQAHNGKNDDGSGVYRCFGLRGTHLFGALKTNESLHLTDTFAGKVSGKYDHRIMYGYYRQNPAKGIYNGTDYSSRLARTYYKASSIIDIDTTTTTILTSTVTKVDPIDTFGMTKLELSIANVLPIDLGDGNLRFEVSITLPEPTNENLWFSVTWNAYNPDLGYASISTGATVMVESGQIQGFSNTGELASTFEGWIVADIDIIYMSDSTQFYLTEEAGAAPPQPTYEVVTQEEEVDGVVVYGGDTYIDYHIDYRSFWDTTRSSTNETGRWSIKSILMYPVESTINLALRTDDIQGYIVWHGHVEEVTNGIKVDGPKYHLQETLRQGIQMWGVNYPLDLGDLYQYNRAYSAMDKTKIFFPEPFDFSNNIIYDTRVIASLPKITGEYTDSWLKFRPNSYIDVDSQYGPIVRLLNVANKLIYFQPDGLGILSVNDRALIQDNNAGKLTLGSAGVLPRFDYLSYTTGISTHDAAVKADTTFFYIDAQRKRIYTFGGGDVPVSAVKGVNSTLKALEYNYVNTGFEPDANRIYFTIDDTTFVYNEFQQAFTHSLLITPAHYITLDNGFYTIENQGEENPLLANDFTNIDYNDLGDPILISDGTVGTTIFKIGNNPTGIFNNDGGITAECFVDLIIHPEGVTKCSFDNIELTMEILNNNDEEVYTDDTTTYQPVFNTIKQIVFSNSYMSKTVDIVYGQNIKRIGRSWKLQVPLVADRKVPTRSNRFVDTYLRMKIYFDNTTVNRLRLHDVITYYRPISV